MNVSFLTELSRIKKVTLFNIISLIGLLVSTIILFQNAFQSAYRIWLVSEVFNHCLLILPIVCFLIYRKKDALLSKPLKPTPIFLIPIAGLLALSAFAEIGDISVISHLALFTFIPLAILTIIGIKAAKEITFPLLFILFAVPIGEELIPYLQEITADMSVYLLQVSQIPVYRSGLFIDIPNGKFLVAEACSGISFLISSFAFGSLYAHLNFYNNRSKLIFILISIVVPIFANAIRVYGIIVIAYFSDMKYAVGADHLIYGWVFYVFILFCIFMIGEYLRPKSEPKVPNYSMDKSWCITPIYKISLVIVAMMLATQFWLTYTATDKQEAIVLNFNSELPWRDTNKNPLGTSFTAPDKLVNKQLLTDNYDVHLSVATYFADSHSEAISNSTIIFDKNYWSMRSAQATFTLKEITPTVRALSSVKGHTRLYAHWYVINGKPIEQPAIAKLYETYLKLVNSHQYTNVIVVSWLADTSKDIDKKVSAIHNKSAVFYKKEIE